jgi:membrane protease YdiL (CAAX protease family)
VNDDLPPVSKAKDWAAVAFALIFPTLVTWVYFVWLANDSAGIQQASYSLGKLIQFAFPLAWVLIVQRQSLAWSRPRVAGLASGAAFGLAIVAAMLLLYHMYLKPAGFFENAAGVVNQKVAGFGIDSPLKYAALAIFYSAGHSLMEEYYWRWFVFAQLRRLASLPAAVVISSLGFMAHHVLVLAAFFGWASPATYALSLCVAIGGGVWAWLYGRSQSLYAPWLSHMLIDAGIFLIGYDLLLPSFSGSGS